MPGDAQESLEQMLSAYLDGELGESQRRQVEARLREDDHARRLLEELRATVDAVRTLPRAHAPAELMSQMRARLERQALLGEQSEAASTAAGESTGRARALAAAAVIALAFFSGYIIWDVTGRGGGGAGTMPMASSRSPAPGAANERELSQAQPDKPAESFADGADKKSEPLAFGGRAQSAATPPLPPAAAAVADSSLKKESPPAEKQISSEAIAEAKLAERDRLAGGLVGGAVRGSASATTADKDQPANKSDVALDTLAESAAQAVPSAEAVLPTQVVQPSQVVPPVLGTPLAAETPAAQPRSEPNLYWLAQRRSEEQAKLYAARARSEVVENVEKRPATAPAMTPPAIALGSTGIESADEVHTAFGVTTRPATLPDTGKPQAATQPASTTQPTQPATSPPAD